MRLVDDEPPRVRLLPDARPTGCLLGFDGDAPVYLTDDGTLTAISIESGKRHAIKQLRPAPAAVAITPEYVIWCSAVSPDGPGEVWRWWRDADRTEQLATHESATPQLAIRPVPLPYPRERLATDVAIAVDQRLGLIDVEGVEWIAELRAGVLHLACTTTAIVCALPDRVVRCDLDTEACETLLELRGPPRALVATAERVIVACDCVPVFDLGGQVACDPVAEIYEITDGGVRCAGPLDDPAWLRNRMYLACDPDGAVLVEEGAVGDNIDRVTYLPFDWRPCVWNETLQIRRVLPDGRCAHVMIEDVEWWSGPIAGRISSATLRAVNEWLSATPPSATRPPDLRGWYVSIGEHVWWSQHGEPLSPPAQAIARLIALLEPSIPPLALVARLGRES